MKKSIVYGLLFMYSTLSLSCLKERIEPDYSIYGDKAFIKSVNTFFNREIKTKLNFEEVVTGYQNVVISNTTTFDNPNKKINIVLAKATGADVTTLSKIGIRLNTDAQRIEPLNGAPTAGVVGDFSKGPYVYRVYSADGTVRDWTLTFSVAP